MALDSLLQKYYEDRLAMMSSPAWKELMEDVKTMRDSTDTVSGLDDLRKLGIRQGEVSMMDWFINIEQISRDAYEELKNETA